MATAGQRTKIPSVDDLVFAEQVYSLYRFDFTGPAAAVAAGVTIATLAWGIIGMPWIAGWLIVVLAMVALWIVLLVRFRSAEPEAHEVAVWYQRLFAGAVCAGLIWGATGIIFLSSINITLRIATAIILVAVAAGALPVLAAIWRLYALFCTLTLGISAIAVLIAGGAQSLLITLLLIGLLAFLLMTAWQHNVTFSGALTLAFRNEDLLRQARSETDRMQALNVALQEDVSRHDLTRQELIRTKEAAEAATRAKSAFLTNVSHEVRTPLHSIVGLANLAIREHPPETVRNHIVKILASAHSLMGTVSTVLDFSRIESGKLAIDQAPFRLRDITENIHSIFSTMAREKGLAFSIVVDPAFPAEVIGDPVRVTQILNNFVSNAIKYTDHGAITVDARAISRTPQRVMAKLSVTDSGHGLSEDEQKKLFESSPRTVSTAPMANVAGLGLAICQHLSAIMGGRIGVDSDPGKGSKFWTELPFALPAEDMAAESRETAAEEEKPDLNGIAVLLVEDNQFNQLVASTLLQQQGVKVTIVNNGQEAVDAVLRDGIKVNLVLMDLHMPKMDGKDATRAIRAQRSPAELPIIALTANAVASEKQECLDIGMNAYLTKPIVPKDLFSAIARFTRKPS